MEKRDGLMRHKTGGVVPQAQIEVGLTVFDCNAVPLGTVADVFGAVFKLASFKPNAPWNNLWVGRDHIAEIIPGQQILLAIAAGELEEFGFRSEATAS